MGVTQLKYAYFLLLLSVSFQPCYAQKWTVEGQVKDGSGQAVKNANITLQDTVNSSRLQFTTSNKNGEFKIIVQQGHRYQLHINALGYVELERKIQFTVPPKPQQFILAKATEKLQEVLLETTRAIIRKKDTIIFDASAFTRGTERSVEDLLKQIPGLTITQDGSVYVGNQEIEKILVDGDDFLGKQYQLISKNLNVAVVDAVEVISKYQENPLLKGIVDSDKKALNLVIKEQYKRVWFGNISLGHDVAGADYYGLKFNLMKLGKTAKHYLIGNFNNNGMSSGANGIYITPSDRTGFDLIAEDEQLRRRIDLSPMQLPIATKRYRDNQVSLVNYNSIFNLSDNVELTTNFIGNWQRKQFYNANTTRYLNGLDFVNTKTRTLRDNSFNGTFKSTVKADLSPTENLKVTAKFIRHNSRQMGNYRFNGSHISPYAKAIKERLDLKTTYVNKLNDNAIISVNARYIQAHSPEKYTIDTFLYHDLFSEIAGDSVKQTTDSKLRVMAVNTMIQLAPNTSVTYGLKAGASQKTNQLRSLFSIYEQTETHQPSAYQNKLNFSRSDLYVNAFFDYSFNHFQLGAKLEARQLFLAPADLSSNINGQTSYLSPQLNATYHISNQQKIGLTYTKRFRSVMPSMRFTAPILSNLRAFVLGRQRVDLLASENWFLSYSLGEWTAPFNLSIIGSYSDDHDYYTLASTIKQNYSFNRQVLAKDQTRLRLSTQANYYLNALSTNFNLGLGYRRKDYQRAVNGTNFTAILAQNWRVDAGLSSAFNGGFNFNLGGQYSHSIIQAQQQHKVDFLKTKARFNYRFTSDFALQTSVNYLKFFDTAFGKDTYFIDLDANYNFRFINQDFELHLTASNLLNTTTFTRINLSDIYYAQESYRLLPRMIFIGLNWRF